MKRPGFDDLFLGLINDCETLSRKNIFDPIKYHFSLLLKQGVFPESLKIAHVSPICKNDEKILFTN